MKDYRWNRQMNKSRWKNSIKLPCDKCEKEEYYIDLNTCSKCEKSLCVTCWYEGKDEFSEMVRGDMQLFGEAEYHSEYCPECFFDEFKKYVEQEKHNRRQSEIRTEREQQEAEQRRLEYEKECERNRLDRQKEEERRKRETMSMCAGCHEYHDNDDFETCENCGTNLCSSCIEKFVQCDENSPGSTIDIIACPDCYETVLRKHGVFIAKDKSENGISSLFSDSSSDSDYSSFPGSPQSGFDSCSFDSDGGFGDGGFGGGDDSGGGF